MLISAGYAHAQSPKKLLKNGFYEQAFVDAVAKQNRKVKLKKKFSEVIYPSYDTIYRRHLKVIQSPNTDWQHSFNAFIRTNNFLLKVRHPGIQPNLENILYDSRALDFVAVKFNNENSNDLNMASTLVATEDFEEALKIFETIGDRHEKMLQVPSFKDRLKIINYESDIETMHQRIGDQLIVEASKLLLGTSKSDAQKAITLINQASHHRPLTSSEEELLILANFIIGDSWMAEASKLMETPTKRNARMAYELINKARSFRTLKQDEEQLLEKAEDLGMTRILVTMLGDDHFQDVESFSGILNKKKSTRWVTYYSSDENGNINYALEITERQPKVTLGDIRREVRQNSEQVEYWDEEVNAAGDTVKVKKTKTVYAMVAVVSRTKAASLNWAYRIKDVKDGKVIHSENEESRVQHTNEYASLESGDILALPDNIKTGIDLDSQPFLTDKEMKDQVIRDYTNFVINKVNRVVPNL
ncbi:MAG: hypothetical protein DCO96_10495 [Fluviicola sp. XM-24bin1]|nr:MAG: hypothetical protein DCO96_10495 [Fluviicola sp. XM-24bin1]